MPGPPTLQDLQINEYISGRDVRCCGPKSARMSYLSYHSYKYGRGTVCLIRAYCLISANNHNEINRLCWTADWLPSLLYGWWFLYEKIPDNAHGEGDSGDASNNAIPT